MDYVGTKKHLACAIGLDKAILVTYIIEGIVKNKNNKKDEFFQEDEWWFTKSLHDIEKDLPFWSLDKIQRELTKLRQEEIIVAKKLYINNVNPPFSYRIDYNKLGPLMLPYIDVKEKKED